MTADRPEPTYAVPDLLEGHLLKFDLDYGKRSLSLIFSDRCGINYDIYLASVHHLMVNIIFGSSVIDYCKVYDASSPPQVIRDMAVAVLPAGSKEYVQSATIDRLVAQVLSREYLIFECVPIGGTDLLVFAEEISIRQTGT